MNDLHSLIAVTCDALRLIDTATASGGDLKLANSSVDNIFTVASVETMANTMIQVHDVKSFAALRKNDRFVIGQWLSGVSADVHLLHRQLLARPTGAISPEQFRKMVPNVGYPDSSQAIPLLTRVDQLPAEFEAAGVARYAGWNVTADEVFPLNVVIEPKQTGLAALNDRWPVDDLRSARAVVVGLGSVGGAVAQSLAAYGVGHLDLVDPDRFLWHNMVRHLLGPESVGRLKVDALKDLLGERWCADVNTYPLDVVEQADYFRALLADADVVVCAADGIAPRRVVSHEARRAGIPAVLACVLGDGAVGEVLRLRPGPRFGCLLCQREHLRVSGGIDPEGMQEANYGSGMAHLPMTAIGPDLWLVAALAAKATVATLLERGGHGEHRLPGEHAVITLRSGNDYGSPFDAQSAGMVTWNKIVEPRPECTTCAPDPA